MADKATFQKFKDITEAMKADWRKKYPDAIVVSFPIDKDEAALDPADWTKKCSFVIAPPDRSVLNALEKYGAEHKFVQFNASLKKNCVLGGDMELLEQDVNEFVYRSVLKAAAKMIKTSEGVIAKL